MIRGALNWDKKECVYWQTNNSFEAMEPGLDWCNATMDTIAWASLTPLDEVEEAKNPYGGTWKIQPEDYISAYYRSPFNIEKFKAIRDLDFSIFPPERIPQYRKISMKEVFNIDSEYREGRNFEAIGNLLWDGNCVGLNLIQPGHYICAVAFSVYDGMIGFKDPWPGNKWPNGIETDKNGNKWFSKKDFIENIKPFYILYKKRA